MFCGNCGAKTSDQADFCHACGHDLKSQGRPVAESSATAPPDVDATFINDAPRSGFWRRFAAHLIDVAIVWFALTLILSDEGGIFRHGFGIFDYGYLLSEDRLDLAGYLFATPFVQEFAGFLGSISEWVSYSRSYDLGYRTTAPWIHFAVENYIPVAAVFSYYVIVTYLWGHTPGKAALGIRVVARDGNPPGLVRVIVRETLGKPLSLIFWIGFLMASGKQKLGLHDRISGTEVIVSSPSWRLDGNVAEEDEG